MGHASALTAGAQRVLEGWNIGILEYWNAGILGVEKSKLCNYDMRSIAPCFCSPLFHYSNIPVFHRDRGEARSRKNRLKI